VIAAGLYLGSAAFASGASAAPCTVASTWANPSTNCLKAEQRVLGENLNPIEVHPNQMSIPGLDYVDPNSTTGLDLFAAMEEEGTLPAPEVWLADYPALELVPDVGTPLLISLTFAGAVVTVSFGIRASVDELAGDGRYSSQLAPAPQWIHVSNICPDDPDTGGEGNGPGWVLEWLGLGPLWASKYGAGQFADHGSGCGIPYYQDGDVQIVGTQLGNDFHAMQDYFTAQVTRENNCLNDEGYSGFPVYSTGNGVNSTGSGDLHGWYVTDTEMRDLIACTISELDPSTHTGTRTLEQTATALEPFVNGDFAEATRLLQLDPAAEATVNKALEGTSDPNSDAGTGTGTSFDCPNVNIGRIDFGPLSGLSFGNSFPFGAILWAKNGVAGWDTGTNDAPVINVPLIGSGQGHPVHADLSILDGLMVTVREFVLMACTFGLVWFLATAAFGFSAWGEGEQGSLF
jgi:hypothetical protein